MLANRIWYTRKSRIEASDRLARNNLHAQVLSVYYSLYIVSVSILNLQSSSSDLTLLTVIGSVMILVAFTFMVAVNFKERSLMMRICYTQLDKLYYQAVRLEEDQNPDQEEVEALEDEYTDLLRYFENHTTFDYLCVKKSLMNDPCSDIKPLQGLEKFSFWAHL